MEPRLLRHYKEYARPKLAEQFQWSNPNQIPKIEKVVLNVGVGEASKNAKLLTAVVDELGIITGQKAVITRARRSVSNFQLREGMPIGATVTLWKSRMYEFMDRLVSVVIPRVRDFRGLRTRSFDGRATSRWVCESRSFFRRSTTTRSNKFTAWTSPWSRTRIKTMKRWHCSGPWAFPSRGRFRSSSSTTPTDTDRGIRWPGRL